MKSIQSKVITWYRYYSSVLIHINITKSFWEVNSVVSNHNKNHLLHFRSKVQQRAHPKLQRALSIGELPQRDFSFPQHLLTLANICSPYWFPNANYCENFSSSTIISQLLIGKTELLFSPGVSLHIHSELDSVSMPFTISVNLQNMFAWQV